MRYNFALKLVLFGKILDSFGYAYESAFIFSQIRGYPRQSILIFNCK